MPQNSISPYVKNQLVESFFESEVNKGTMRPEQLANPSVIEKKKHELAKKIETFQSNIVSGLEILKRLNHEKTSLMIKKLEQESKNVEKGFQNKSLNYNLPEQLLSIDDCKFLYEMGFNEHSENRLRESFLIFLVMSTYFPGNPFSWMGVIQSSHQLGDPEYSAKEFCDIAVNILAEEPIGLVFCSEFYYQVGCFLEAKDTADLAISLLEKDPDPDLMDRAKAVSNHAGNR